MVGRFSSSFPRYLLMVVVAAGICSSSSPAQWLNGQKAQYVLGGGQPYFKASQNGVSATLLGSLGTHGFDIDYSQG